jgi:hypothetical protein
MTPGLRYEYLMFEYLIAEDEWRKLFEFELDVENVEACTIKDKLYIVGSNRERKSGASIRIYEVAQMTTEDPLVSELPSPGIDGSIFSVECLADFIFALGKDSTNSVIGTYYPQREEWVISEMPNLVSSIQFSTTTLFSDIYLAGGISEQGITSEFTKYLAVYTIQMPIIQQSR